MTSYADKSYGRNEEVDVLYRMFDSGRNVSMHGPRRLGKTFLLDRLVDAASSKGWIAVKVELAGCNDTRGVFRELCSRIGTMRAGGAQALAWVKQRLGQFIEPRTDSGGAWYQPFVSLDHEAYFERLIHAMHDDPKHRWVLLIDELPIFLKALHDRGGAGVTSARDFMNLLVRLQQQYPRVRWMVTGSIGIEPLAQSGNYLGVLAKFANFHLAPLTVEQSKDYVISIAESGHLLHRKEITAAEADAIVEAVGWRAAYYLDALAQKLMGEPQADQVLAARLVDEAVNRLIAPGEMTAFGVWEEHLRKHYSHSERVLAFAILNALSRQPQRLPMDSLLIQIDDVSLTPGRLRQVLMRLFTEGFIVADDWTVEVPLVAFLNPLLRRWWSLTRPQADL